MKAVIEFEFDECLEDEFAKNYLETVGNMFHLFHFVESVTKCEIVDEREYLVDYNEKYCKAVMARNADEARELVINQRMGKTLYHNIDTVSVEEKV